jgi:hypothetical protein
MAETNDSLSHSFAFAVLAKREAIKAVKEDLRARGVKLSYVSPKDIRIVAQEYLAAHPELLMQAERLIASEPIFREFGNDRTGNGMARRTAVSEAS